MNIDIKNSKDKMMFVKDQQNETEGNNTFKIWKILIVDDENAVHDMIARVLKRFDFNGEKLHFLHANSGEEANYLIKKHPDISLILLDVVMETDDAGLRCVKYVRNVLKNNIVQIVLLTGQPGQAPEQSIIKDYGINNYQSKAELTAQRLSSTITIALRAYQLSYSLKREILERKRVEKELKEAKSIADAANLAKTNFLSTMSHELRTPMNGIIGVTDILIKSNQIEENKTLLNIIFASGNALLKILNDILDLTRLESKQLVLEEVLIDLEIVCKNIFELFKSEIKLKDLDFSIDIDNAIKTCYLGDLNRLNQILSNLISNAIKFTETGSIYLEIKLIDSNPNKAILQFNIIDTGIGIPQDSFSKIFSSFTQVDGSKSRKFSGIGAGLAITKYLTDFMGGVIGVDSKLKEGSRFWVNLPFNIIKS